MSRGAPRWAQTLLWLALLRCVLCARVGKGPRGGNIVKAQPTKGKTARCRLRRIDGFVLAYCGDALAPANGAATFVDVGYGFLPVTTLETAAAFGGAVEKRRRESRAETPKLRVLGLEADVERVRLARETCGEVDEVDLRFEKGGFDVSTALSAAYGAGAEASVIRVMNVLRQDYTEQDAADSHSAVTRALHANGVALEGTCDPAGDLNVFNVLRKGPSGVRYEALVFACRIDALQEPRDFRAVLPKSFIHACTQGAPIHGFLERWQKSWDDSPRDGRARFLGAAQDLAQQVRGVDARKRLLQRGFIVWRQDANCAAAADVRLDLREDDDANRR
ncbi:hypothetical protein M885DRAFT_522613 [Pelagophyceae sp. CCMP2097]|nr:hypothetical protein M885DRAFT_522613 [Pelagophyceae sp. CCMP2097]